MKISFSLLYQFNFSQHLWLYLLKYGLDSDKKLLRSSTGVLLLIAIHSPYAYILEQFHHMRHKLAPFYILRRICESGLLGSLQLGHCFGFKTFTSSLFFGKIPYSCNILLLLTLLK